MSLRTIRALFVSLSCLALTVAGCDCGGGTSEATSELAVNPKTLDWGQACIGDTSAQTLVLQNLGRAPLTISSLDIVGDAFTLLDPAPQGIDGGDELAVRVGFSPTASDQYDGSLVIRTDADTRPEQRVALTGTGFQGERQKLSSVCACVNDPVRSCGEASGTFEECFFLSFNEVPGGTSLQRTLRLRNDGCATIEVSAVSIRPDPASPTPADDARFFSTVGPTSFRLPGGATQDVVVKFDAPFESTVPLALLHVSSNDPTQPERDVSLQGMSIAAALTVDVEALTFFEAVAGTPLRKEIQVRNSGTAAIQIASVTLEAEDGTRDFSLDLPNGESAFTLAPAGQAGFERILGVVYNASGSGADRATVLVRTAAGEERRVRLLGGTFPTLEVAWLETASGTESSPPVDFGDTATGAQNIRRILRLKNVGQAPLRVSNVAVTENTDSYSVDGFQAVTVDPGRHADVQLVFSDRLTLVNDSGVLTISSDDPTDDLNGGARRIDLQSRNAVNLPPVAVISVDAPAGAGTGRSYGLDGTNSSGPEPTDSLTYAWRISLKPTGSQIRLSDDTQAQVQVLGGTTASPTEGFDVVGTYRFTLTVTDGFGQAGSAVYTEVVRQ